MRVRRCLAAVAALVLLTIAAGCGGGDEERTAIPAPATWLAVSDVHFNPFDGATTDLVDKLAGSDPAGWGAIFAARNDDRLSTYEHDTNYPLLRSVLAAIKDAGADAGVVFVSGDLLGHGFAEQFHKLSSDTSKPAFESFVDKTMAFLADAFNEALPDAQFVVALGNNDSYCGDYMTAPRSPFLKSFAQSWEPLVNRDGRAPGFAASFPQLGAYTALLPTKGGQAIVVNDVYWSRRYQNTCGKATEHPGDEQLAWLTKTVEALPETAAPWLVTHIPPGIDVFGSLRDKGPVLNLDEDHGAGLLKVLRSRQWNVVVAGHVHMSTFRLTRDQPRVALMLVPSISPLFSNNPAYYTLRVGGDGRVLDYTAYVLELNKESPAWRREYAFDATYDADGFDVPSVSALERKIPANPAMRADYIRYYNSGSGIGGITPESTFPAYLCASFNLTVDSYKSCKTAAAAEHG